MYRIKEFSIPRFIYSLILNIAVLCVALFLFTPFFEEIDDTHIAMLAEGAYGSRGVMLIYVNVILGRIYNLFYTMFPMVRWHCVIQYFFIFFGYLTSTYVISKHKHGPLISFLAVISTFYELYVSLQYTKTAAFVTTAGVLLLFERVRDNVLINNAKKEAYGVASKGIAIERMVFTGIGILLITYGAMLRFEACIIACIPLFFVGLLELYRTRLISKYIKVFVPAAIAVICVYTINSFAYKTNPEWNEFTIYNKIRTYFVDYRYDILYYPDNGEELEKLDVTENDALMVVTYQFADTDVFSTEYLEELKSHFPTNRQFNLKIFRMMWGNIREELRRSSVELPALICLIVVLIASIIVERSRSHSESINDSKAKLYSMIFIGIFCALALTYFQFSGRWSHRLIGALVIPTIYAICYMLDGGVEYEKYNDIIFAGNFKDISRELIVFSIAVALGFTGLNYYINQMNYLEAAKSYADGKEELKEISEDKDKLYVVDTFTFQYNFKYDVFKPYKEGELSNFVSCGCWFTDSPVARGVCNRYSYGTPFDAIRNNKGDVVLIDNFYPNEKAQFLTEHYDGEYSAVKIGRNNGYDIYTMEKIND